MKQAVYLNKSNSMTSSKVSIPGLLLIIFAFLIGCSQSKSESKQVVLLNHRQIDDHDSNLVLPKSKNTYPDCIKDDFNDYWQLSIPEELKESGLKYYDYFFDTIIHATSLEFTFRCIGGDNQKAMEQRFLNEYSILFPEMVASAQMEKHKCLYFIVSDSVKFENKRIKYSRYREYTLGGAGAIAFSEQFSMKPTELFAIVNNTNHSSLESSDLLRFRKAKKYF